MVGGTERQLVNQINGLSHMRGEILGFDFIGDFALLPAHQSVAYCHA